MSDKRPLWTVLGLLPLSGAVLWGASFLTWTSDGRSGAEAVPALRALALTCVVAVAAVVASGGWLRRLFGVLVGVLGGTAAWVALATAGAVPPRLVVGLSAVFLLATGVLLVVREASMPRLGGAYQTPGAAKRAADPERDMWNALERGDDPTERN